MAHFAKYMMFKTLVASRRYASEALHIGTKSFLKLNSYAQDFHLLNETKENAGKWFVMNILYR